MTTTEISQQEQQERTLAILRRLVEEKREAERQAVEEFKNDTDLQELIAKLRLENTHRGTAVKL